MPRYIDADEFVKRAIQYPRQSTKTIGLALADTPTADVVDKALYKRLLENSVIIAAALNSYQSADMVEVVRCKDCKWHEWYIRSRLMNGMEYKSNECRKFNMAVTPDWFCADGERRENEHDL